MSLPLISMYVVSRQVSKHVHIVTAHGWKIQMYMISWLSQYTNWILARCVLCVHLLNQLKLCEGIYGNRSRTSEYLFWDYILIYFYAWPMVTTKMSVWITNFSKTYVCVGVLLSKKQLQLQITMGNNCHIIVFVATYILATYIVFKKHIISTHSLQIL